MPVIKAVDLACGRLRSPDLDKEEAFLTDFGMVRADRTKTALYMRGPDAPHHLHVTELGAPRYVGIAVHAASLDYEAADIDDATVGHEHLEGKGYQHMWGIGRHLIGSSSSITGPIPGASRSRKSSGATPRPDGSRSDGKG